MLAIGHSLIGHSFGWCTSAVFSTPCIQYLNVDSMNLPHNPSVSEDTAVAPRLEDTPIRWRRIDAAAI